jgi:hypothetical protein
MSLKLNSSGGGSVTLQEETTATNGTLTMPAGTGTVAVPGLSSSVASGTAQASTSGTAINFTGIPSWVKRITVIFSGVSTTGTSNTIVQLGTGATPTYTTSGYLGSAATSSGATVTNFSTGFMVNNSVGAASVVHGNILIVNVNGNTWVESAVLALSDSANTRDSAGSVTLGAALTALRVTTVVGSDTFDAGTINILYE